MITRLKLMVQSVKSVANADGKKSAEELEFSAAYGDDPTNKQWSRWTPQARLAYTVTNENVFDKFKPGQSVYLDISAVDGWEEPKA